MTAAEIRAKWARAKPQNDMEVELYKIYFFVELTAQLAELNEKLTPAAIISAVKEIQAKLAAEDPT